METVTLRELRLNFSSVRKKLEEQGAVIITDHGVPSFEIRAVAPKQKSIRPMRDFYQRLISQQPNPISAEAAAQLHEESRGDR